MNIKVEDVRKIEKNINENSMLMGIAKIILNDVLVVENIQIIKHQEEIITIMPFRRNKEGKNIPFVYFLDENIKKQVNDTLINAYNGIERENGQIEKMEITDNKIFKMNNNSGLKAVASIVLNNQIVIPRIMVVEIESDNTKNLHIKMPMIETKSGEWKNIVYAINASFYNEIEDSILNEYNKQ